MAESDLIGTEGIQTKDYNTLLNEIRTSFQSIYGRDGEEINFDSNTPDGQLTSLIAEMGVAIRELITEVYNTCDPTKCSGSVQDARYQINYLTRNKGTFTQQLIKITTNKTVSLQGLDASYNETDASAFAVSDDSGNIWYLIDSVTITAGESSLLFRAKERGQVIPTVGTITNQVTIIDGITNVINEVGYTDLGTEEESDSDFRIRRERSVANYSGNNIDSMLGNILALEGVSDAIIHVNNTNAEDETGTLPQYIWAIVEGGANTDIAEVIYSCLAGCGTRGDVTVPQTTASQQILNINFDRPTTKSFYLKFDIYKTKSGVIDADRIKENIVENLSYKIGQTVETSKITTICSEALTTLGVNGYALNVLVSDDNTDWVEVLNPTTIADIFVLDAERITINEIGVE